MLLGITPGQRLSCNTWPGTMTIGMSGEPTGLSDSYITNFVGDYSQGRTTTCAEHLYLRCVPTQSRDAQPPAILAVGFWNDWHEYAVLIFWKLREQ